MSFNVDRILRDFENGKSDYFELVQNERWMPVSTELLVQHSGYFAKLIKDGTPETKHSRSVWRTWKVPDEIDFDLLAAFIELLYNGESWRGLCPNDIKQNVELWELADFLDVESVMHTIELNLIARIGSMKQKYRAIKPEMLDLVFFHPKCSNSTVGFIVAEAAMAVWFTTGKAEYLRSLDRARNNFPVLRQHMGFWSELYLRYYSACMIGHFVVIPEATWSDKTIEFCQPLRRHMIESRLGIASFSDSDFFPHMDSDIDEFDDQSYEE
ncbi:hypothetical protein K4K52_010620 [Colletotrichum sp. SAR 10_76]|nr:hypothetical protein K4K52_010620 [Colletotrichum sp. SAR 10_76]